MSDPRPTRDLNIPAAWPFDYWADEITIRVVQYDPVYRPLRFQVTVRHHFRSKPPIFGEGDSVQEALEAATRNYYEAYHRAPDDSEIDEMLG